MTTAPDRGVWMAECAARRPVHSDNRPAEVVVTFTGLSGQVIDRARVNVATGRREHATVLPLRRS